MNARTWGTELSGTLLVVPAVARPCGLCLPARGDHLRSRARAIRRRASASSTTRRTCSSCARTSTCRAISSSTRSSVRRVSGCRTRRCRPTRSSMPESAGGRRHAGSCRSIGQNLLHARHPEFQLAGPTPRGVPARRLRPRPVALLTAAAGRAGAAGRDRGVAARSACGARPPRSARPPREDDIKAAFLYNFTKFIAWPAARRQRAVPHLHRGRAGLWRRGRSHRRRRVD